MRATHETNGQSRDDARLERELSELKNQYEGLKERKVRAEQDLANLRRQLDELRRKAQAEYGASDPAELERLLAEKREENRRLVEEYRAHIEGVRQALNQVESDLERQG